jgi:hypothetical protein
MRGMFGSETEKVTGVWRRLLNGEFYNLYSSPNIIGLSFPRGCASRGERKRENGNPHGVFIRKREGTSRGGTCGLDLFGSG